MSIGIIGIPEGEQREKWLEKILGEIIDFSFAPNINLMKEVIQCPWFLGVIRFFIIPIYYIFKCK